MYNQYKIKSHNNFNRSVELMKYSNPKKLSIHLDFATFKAEFQNSLPSSTKKISTQPNSPNGIAKNIKTQ